MGEELQRDVASRARQDQKKRRQTGLSTQVQQCFGKEPTSTSPCVGRRDEHHYGLVAPLFYLVSADLAHFIFEPKYAGHADRGTVPIFFIALITSAQHEVGVMRNDERAEAESKLLT